MDIIVSTGEAAEQAEHCPACEMRFAAMEQRLTAIEQHHPVMDANTEEALETAEEALETAETAATVATVATLMAEPPPDVAPIEEEDRHDEAPEPDDGAGAAEGDGAESGAQAEEPVIISPAPDEQPDGRRGTSTRFARGRRR